MSRRHLGTHDATDPLRMDGAGFVVAASLLDGNVTHKNNVGIACRKRPTRVQGPSCVHPPCATDHNNSCKRGSGAEEDARYDGKDDEDVERETQEARHRCGTGGWPLLTNRPPAGPPRWVANTMQELVQAAQVRLVYRQVVSVRTEEATLRRSWDRSGETVQGSDTLVATLCRLV